METALKSRNNFPNLLFLIASYCLMNLLHTPDLSGTTTFQITTAELSKEIQTRITRVTEFKTIWEWAEKKQIKVYLAGGTAAGFAHYVRDDLEREWRKSNGMNSPFFDSRFHYHYFEIFRSTQDADIVIDGTEADAVELESHLRDHFPYVQGSKSTWEMRLLREKRGSGVGEKEPLIGESGFQMQNSDSHSTGLILVSKDARYKDMVKDLFFWESDTAPFLTDVINGTLHFYPNPKHTQSPRYLKGLNPEILSVIRYFTKAFQYGLKMREQDVPAIQEIINRFDPKVTKTM